MKVGVQRRDCGWWRTAEGWRGTFIDALGDFLCTQAITTKEHNSSRETYSSTPTPSHGRPRRSTPVLFFCTMSAGVSPTPTQVNKHSE